MDLKSTAEPNYNSDESEIESIDSQGYDIFHLEIDLLQHLQKKLSVSSNTSKLQYSELNQNKFPPGYHHSIDRLRKARIKSENKKTKSSDLRDYSNDKSNKQQSVSGVDKRIQCSAFNNVTARLEKRKELREVTQQNKKIEMLNEKLKEEKWKEKIYQQGRRNAEKNGVFNKDSHSRFKYQERVFEENASTSISLNKMLKKSLKFQLQNQDFKNQEILKQHVSFMRFIEDEEEATEFDKQSESHTSNNDIWKEIEDYKDPPKSFNF